VVDAQGSRRVADGGCAGRAYGVSIGRRLGADGVTTVRLEGTAIAAIGLSMLALAMQRFGRIE
jgi:hypothetical protein